MSDHAITPDETELLILVRSKTHVLYMVGVSLTLRIRLKTYLDIGTIVEYCGPLLVGYIIQMKLKTMNTTNINFTL